MKKDFFYVLLILVLVKLAASPIPQLQNQTEKKDAVSPVKENPQIDKTACNVQAEQSTDELTSLTNQVQNSKTNPCLFLGCNGFF